VLAFASQAIAAEFDDMVRRVPKSTNFIALVNVEKIMASPMAQKEGWDVDPAKRFAAGLINVPSGVQRVVMAAEYDLELVRPLWQVGLVRMERVPQLSVLANRYHGATDTLAGMPVVRLPDDSYVVRFSDHLAGGYTPGNRQAVSRWIREDGEGVSPYLAEAMGYANRGTEVIVALDLADVAAEADIRQVLSELDNEILARANVDTTKLAELLTGIKGLMLGITFNERAFGKIKVDFERDASVLSGIAKPLFLAVLARQGMMIDEFVDWQVKVEGNRVTCGGYLTGSGLTRISSLVDLPTQAMYGLHEAAGARRDDLHENRDLAGTVRKIVEKVNGRRPPSAGNGDSPAAATVRPGIPKEEAPRRDPKAEMAESSRRYFQSIQHLRSNLRSRRPGAKTFGQISVWYENYSRKIDRLPMLGVDDLMLDYGGFVGSQFRQAASAIRLNASRSRVGQVRGINQGALVWYHGFLYRRGLTLREARAWRNEMQAVTRADMLAKVQQIENEIDNRTAETRRAMTQKYEIPF
jgi:hypothetical protein